jgi:hypothetical protein
MKQIRNINSEQKNPEIFVLKNENFCFKKMKIKLQRCIHVDFYSCLELFEFILIISISFYKKEREIKSEKIFHTK